MSDQPTAPNGRPLEHLAPPSHFRAAHGAHGYCSACPGIEPDTELVAWRLREDALHHAAGTTDQAPEPSADGPEDAELPFFVESTVKPELCPVCLTEEPSLLVSTFTATTESGTYEIGSFTYCLICKDIPRARTEVAHG